MMPENDELPAFRDNSGILYPQKEPVRHTLGDKVRSMISSLKETLLDAEQAVYDRLAEHGQMCMQRELAPARIIIPTGHGNLTPEAYRELHNQDSGSGVFSHIREAGGNRRLFTLGGAVLAGAMAGLALTPSIANAEPITLDMNSGTNGAHLYLCDLEPNQPTNIHMLSSPFAQPTLGDIVKVLPAGVSYAEVQNNWLNKSDDTGACLFMVTQTLPGSDSDVYSNRLGRATPWYLFNHPLTDDPNVNPTFPQDLAQFTAGLDTLLLVTNQSGLVVYPLGQHIEDQTHRIQDIQATGAPANQSTYWNSFNIANRVLNASPKAAGFAGVLPAVLTNPYGASPTKDLVMIVNFEVTGAVRKILEDGVYAGAKVDFVKTGQTDTVTAFTDANGYFRALLPFSGADIFMQVSHPQTDTYQNMIQVVGNMSNLEKYMHPIGTNQALIAAANVSEAWPQRAYPIPWWVGNNPAKEGQVCYILEDLLGSGWQADVDTVHAQIIPPSWPFTEVRGVNTLVDQSSFGHSWTANTSGEIVFGYVRFQTIANLVPGTPDFNAAQEEDYSVFGYHDLPATSQWIGYGGYPGMDFPCNSEEKQILRLKIETAKKGIPMSEYTKFVDRT